jgi:cell division protein FtsI/penicillin-binding protein 2
VHLSLDLSLQRLADDLLSGHPGALVLLNAESGEILVMSSHPGFDANHLDEDWEKLVEDNGAPLLDRSAHGQYPIGPATGPFLLALINDTSSLPPLPHELTYNLGGMELRCAQEAAEQEWGAAIAAGCPNAVVSLGTALGSETIQALYSSLGLYSAPQIRLPAASSARPGISGDAASGSLGFSAESEDLQDSLLVSPLQMAIAAGTLSNSGTRPAPRLAVALDAPQGEGTIFPALGETSDVYSPEAADETAELLAQAEPTIWQSMARAPNGAQGSVTWYLGGTLPGWQGAPLALALVLEEDAPSVIEEIGQRILQAASQAALP